MCSFRRRRTRSLSPGIFCSYFSNVLINFQFLQPNFHVRRLIIFRIFFLLISCSSSPAYCIRATKSGKSSDRDRDPQAIKTLPCVQTASLILVFRYFVLLSQQHLGKIGPYESDFCQLDPVFHSSFQIHLLVSRRFVGTPGRADLQRKRIKAFIADKYWNGLQAWPEWLVPVSNFFKLTPKKLVWLRHIC